MFQLELENERGNIVDINDGMRYIVIGCSGLNPPSAELFLSKSPNRKGAKFNGSSLDERSIDITIKLLGDVEANRNALYPWVDSENYCKIRYKNGVRSVYCEGYVQDCPIEFFTDNEVINLSIICPNPYWHDLVAISTEISNIVKQFVFPFSIDSAGVPLSTILESNRTVIFNNGAETGMRLVVKCVKEASGFMIFDAASPSRLFKIGATLSAGDTLVIDTNSSPKTVKIYRANGTVENAMRYIVGFPTWFTLKNGSNAFAYTTDSGGLESVVVSVEWTQKYKGV